jgi:hypothetical protein
VEFTKYYFLMNYWHTINYNTAFIPRNSHWGGKKANISKSHYMYLFIFLKRWWLALPLMHVYIEFVLKQGCSRVCNVTKRSDEDMISCHVEFGIMSVLFNTFLSATYHLTECTPDQSWHRSTRWKLYWWCRCNDGIIFTYWPKVWYGAINSWPGPRSVCAGHCQGNRSWQVCTNRTGIRVINRSLP